MECQVVSKVAILYKSHEVYHNECGIILLTIAIQVLLILLGSQ